MRDSHEDGRVSMIVLDYSDKRPIYEQIVDRMRTLIAGGVLEPDEKLPSVRSLAVDLSINPNTIQRAYAELERDGFIYSVRGRGNFVRADSGLLKRQQEKLMEGLRRQLVVCRDQQVDYDQVLSCLQEVYGRCKDD